MKKGHFITRRIENFENILCIMVMEKKCEESEVEIIIGDRRTIEKNWSEISIQFQYRKVLSYFCGFASKGKYVIEWEICGFREIKRVRENDRYVSVCVFVAEGEPKSLVVYFLI